MRAIITAASALFIAFAAITAQAHALLERAQPRVGSTVASPPSQVTLYFSQRLEPSLSSITVTNASGQRVDAGRTSVSGSTMSVPLRSIGVGTYRVTWRALSVDTHTTEGSFAFTVGGR
jgi:methionine-rich copper-binding protein CopC